MKKIIHNPHDKFFRASLSDSRVAKAFFEDHLPPAIKAKVNLDTLQLQKESYVDEHLKLALTDILFTVSLEGQPGYLYTLVEHQSTPDKLMPFRLLKYMIAIMEQHLKTTQQNQLPVVYPLLFYSGQTAYPYSTDLFALFQEHAPLAKQIFLEPFQLVDLSQIPDEALKQNLWRGIMELCMKHVFARDLLPFLQDMLHLLQNAEAAGGRQYVQTALTYLLTTGEVSNSDAFLATIQHGLSPQTGATLMTIAQQIEAKGEARGIEKGRSEGRSEGLSEGLTEGEIRAKKAIARKLLQQGLSIIAISQITELTASEIEALLETASH